MLRGLNRLLRLRSFTDDTRGVSAVEFAFIAPVLIAAYLGLAELTLGMMASRRASHLAATVGDLAAQSESLTNANMTDIFDIGTSMLQPFSAGTSLKMRVTSVTMNSQNKAVVNWSDGRNMTAYAKNDIIAAITTTQISQGESLVMTEVVYDYTSPLGDFLPGVSHFTDTFYHHPRNGTAITRTP